MPSQALRKAVRTVSGTMDAPLQSDGGLEHSFGKIEADEAHTGVEIHHDDSQVHHHLLEPAQDEQGHLDEPNLLSSHSLDGQHVVSHGAHAAGLMALGVPPPSHDFMIAPPPVASHAHGGVDVSQHVPLMGGANDGMGEAGDDGGMLINGGHEEHDDGESFVAAGAAAAAGDAADADSEPKPQRKRRRRDYSAEDDKTGGRKWFRRNTLESLKNPPGEGRLAQDLPRRLAEHGDWETAEKAIFQWAVHRGFTTTVFRTSDKTHKQIGCGRSGKYRPGNKESKRGRGGESSRKCDCPWMLKLLSVAQPITNVIDEPGIYVIEYPKGDHNHELDYTTRTELKMETLAPVHNLPATIPMPMVLPQLSTDVQPQAHTQHPLSFMLPGPSAVDPSHFGLTHPVLPAPFRFSVMTFNVWCSHGEPANWPARQLSFCECLRRFQPDVLCIQEAHPILIAAIQETLMDHDHIQPQEEETGGWNTESNIFWRRTLFEEVEHGAFDIGMHDLYPDRFMFWAKLRRRHSPNSSLIVVSTAHLPWYGNALEVQTAENMRMKATQTVTEYLKHLAPPGTNTPAFFMGDLNESYHPIRILREAGLNDCFSALGLPIVPTHPSRPSSPDEDALADDALDWLTSNGVARCVLAQVIKGATYGTLHSPSDHCPVMGVYELTEGLPLPLPSVTDGGLLSAADDDGVCM